MKKTTKYILYFLLLSFIFTVAIYFSIPSQNPFYRKNTKKQDVVFTTRYEIINKRFYPESSTSKNNVDISQKIIEFEHKNRKYTLYIFIHGLKIIENKEFTKELIEYQFRLKDDYNNHNRDYVNAFFFDPINTGEIFNEIFEYENFDIEMVLSRKESKAKNIHTDVKVFITNFQNSINLKNITEYNYKKNALLDNYLLIERDENSKQYYISSDFKKELF
jgi:hypothetical protein